MEDNDRFVDELLDSALAQHRDAEPRPGLEGRIVAHVRAAGQQSSKTRKLWMAVAATAAAVVALVAIRVANRTHSLAPQTSQAVNAVPAPSPTETLKVNTERTPAAGTATKVVEPKRKVRGERKPLRRVQAHHWPSQFPTPAPLTAEEKALVRYVQETPPQVLAASLFKEKFLDQPVEMKSFKITPPSIRTSSVGSPKEEIQ